MRIFCGHFSLMNFPRFAFRFFLVILWWYITIVWHPWLRSIAFKARACSVSAAKIMALWRTPPGNGHIASFSLSKRVTSFRIRESAPFRTYEQNIGFKHKGKRVCYLPVSVRTTLPNNFAVLQWGCLQPSGGSIEAFGFHSSNNSPNIRSGEYRSRQKKLRLLPLNSHFHW